MAKEEMLEFEGVVAEVLPDARCRVKLDNGHEVVAYTSGRMKKNRIRILAGDRVTIEMTPYDLTKGRINFRHKDVRAGTRRAAAAAPGGRQLPPPLICHRSLHAERRGIAALLSFERCARYRSQAKLRRCIRPIVAAQAAMQRLVDTTNGRDIAWRRCAIS